MTSTMQLTKSEARNMFGWVPKSERKTPSLISDLKKQGFETKEAIKAYMRSTIMPATQSGLLQNHKNNNVISINKSKPQTIQKKTKTAMTKTMARERMGVGIKAQNNKINGNKVHQTQEHKLKQSMKLQMVQTQR